MWRLTAIDTEADETTFSKLFKTKEEAEEYAQANSEIRLEWNNQIASADLYDIYIWILGKE
jgi:hypothetical protein